MIKRIAAIFAFVTLALVLAGATHGCDKPSDGAAFWWTWWIYFAAAAGTFSAAAVALFIDKWRPEISPPRLEIRIRQVRGHPGIQRSIEPLATRPGQAIIGGPIPSRWYHLRVRNGNRRVATVHGVRVVLCEIWEWREEQAWSKIWDEEVPMHWMHKEGTERTVGAHADADFCWAMSGEDCVHLETRIAPFSMQRDIPVNKRTCVVMRARGNEVDSERLCVEIFWDGKFDQDEARMAEHFRVRPISDPSPSGGE